MGVEDKMIRWEDPKAEICGPRGGEGMFPHLYKYVEEGPPHSELELGREEVESVMVLERDVISVNREVEGNGEGKGDGEGSGGGRGEVEAEVEVEDGMRGWARALRGAEGWLVY